MKPEKWNQTAIQDFAQTNGLRTKRDECGEIIVPARHGQIYFWGTGRMGMMILSNSVGLWRGRRKKALAGGMENLQNGDTEGTLLFDPLNQDQVRLAIRLVGAKKRRVPSEKQLAVLEAGRERSIDARFRRNVSTERVSA
jgi:hypothetical protein